jgi:hypothetical protein
MNFSKTSRLLLLTLFDWELASRQREHDSIMSMLQDLKQMSRNLQQRAIESDDPQELQVIEQKQQIIYLRRKKTLVLLRESKRRLRKGSRLL